MYYVCSRCGTNNDVNNNFCTKCGQPSRGNQPLYRDTILGKMVVKCPLCQSTNCKMIAIKKVIPAKTKTTYSANLNPLKPFTFVNSKEKVVRKEMDYTVKGYRCLECENEFE